MIDTPYSAPFLIFVRHGHRFHPPVLKNHMDNGLSEKGVSQASNTAAFLAAFLKKNLALSPGTEIRIHCSPLQRCQETARIVEKALRDFSVLFSVEETLREAGSKESPENYILRIRNTSKAWLETAKKLKSKSVVDVWVSHGDWLPEAMRCLTGKDHDFNLAECLILHLPNPEAPLLKMVQNHVPGKNLS